MKDIYNYILESSGYGSPDYIVHHKSEYNFDSDFARAFIYNIKANKILWSAPGKTHNDILFDLDDESRDLFNLYHNGNPIRYVDYISDGELEKINKCGRIWVIPNNVSKHRKFDVYVAWWNELSENDFIKYNKFIVSEYNKKFNYNLESFVGVDNNGYFLLIDPDGKEIVIDKQDKSRKHDLEILKAIHLATQEEKRKFFKGYRKIRDKNFQSKYYNNTKSKTAAEFHNNKTKRYNPITGKIEWGEKIGDSLEDNYINTHYKMKSLLDYILEQRTIGFGEYTPDYGQCVILAGGAASGKGFIQNKIDMTGKVFDVDELKKKYQKMAKAGIFKDDYDYDLTKPEDVARLHQKVKDVGLKGKERKHFWKDRDGNGGDKRHSSGLLPNVIFDMVSDDIKDVLEVVAQAKGSGYKVTLVWVLCNKDVAKVSNIIRGIDKKGKARSVPDSVIEKGHNGAYKTMTDLLGNKYPDVNEFIDIAWLGFSSGWGRMLDSEHEKSPVLKIKKGADNKFVFNKSLVDDFLKVKQPINYDIDDKDHVSLKSFRDGKRGEFGIKKYEKFTQLADDFDESKMK